MRSTDMRIRTLLGTLLIAAALSACGGSAAGAPAATPSPTPDLAHRPSTTAAVTILSPTPGEVVHGTSVTVVIGLSGATITPTYSTSVNPHLGHIHLYLDNQLIYMQYSLSQPVPVHPGFQYSLYAEFVASDHLPFTPRDRTPTVLFRVQ
jgi:hypothetical protein